MPGATVVEGKPDTFGGPRPRSDSGRLGRSGVPRTDPGHEKPRYHYNLWPKSSDQHWDVARNLEQLYRLFKKWVYWEG